MNSNKKDNNGWILCPSKSFPGKFYYFNVLNGETAWSLNDADQKSLRKDNVLQKADKCHSYPEPSSPPEESPTINGGSIQQTISNITRQTCPNIPPMFGQATFPTYISNVDPYMQNVIWTPIQMPMFAKPKQDQVTQTWEPERDILVQACSIPLSKRFINFEQPQSTFFVHCSQYKKDKFTNSYDSQIDKPLISQIFGQTSKSNQNKNDQSIYKVTNNICNELNETVLNSQSYDPKASFQSSLIKKVVRQRTGSESHKEIEDVMYDNQNYKVTSTQNNLITRQRTQSDSDSIFFDKPNNYDHLKSTLPSNNKVQNVVQQNIVSSKSGDQAKSKFVMRKSILNPNNNVHSTSQVKNTGQVEKEVRKQSLWYKEDRNFLDKNKKGNQKKNNMNGKEKVDLLDKLDKHDLRYTLESKRRKSIGIGSLGHPEENKVKTYKSNTKQTETPKKRVTFNLDSETSEEECSERRPQYVNIHTLRRLADHITGYWYIVVDTNVLLEDYEFIDKFVQLDSECKLLIPNAVQSEISSYCIGDCRGQQRVIVARQLSRRLATPPPHLVVQLLENEDECFTNMSTMARILNCCLQIIEQNDHVVLITEDSVLYEKAKSLKIHCYKLKDIKDGASIPLPIIFTVKKETSENLFLQKEFDSTWKIPTNTSKKTFTEENILKTCDVQTDVTLTTDANTSPINFEETVENNNGNSKDYLNFDYDDNSDTNISKTMKKLLIKDNNSNFIIKNSMTKNANKLDDREYNSFIFQIKNKNNFQKENITFNKIHNLKEQKCNPFQYSNEKFNNTQNSIKKSIFNIPSDPLKYVKFQIRNKTSQKETEIIQKKNVEFRIQTNEKEIQILPNSNNRRFMQDKIKISIQEKLKNRFQVTSNFMENNIRSNIEECICTFTQVMENALSGLLQQSNLSSLILPPPWTLHEAVTCVKQVHSELWAVCVVADELLLLLLNNSDKNGQLKRKMKANDFMRVFGCGVLLLENLQATEHMSEDITEAQQLLDDMLLTLHNGKEDVDLVRTPVLTRSGDDDDDRLKRHCFIKTSAEVLKYLKKHYPAWNQEDSAQNTPPNDDEVTTQENDTKIVRTCGRDLNLLTIDNSKSMTMNAKETPTTDNQKEKSSQPIDNDDKTDINISPNTLMGSENTIRLYDRSEEPKVVKRFDVQKDILNLNQNENSQNSTVSTVKLYEGPKIVRIFDVSTPFPTKKTSKNTNNELILLSPKHGNTFGGQEETAGPKVVRNIKLIDAFEEKLKFKVDIDELDYSVMEETSTVINSSQFVIDGNDLYNDKVSLDNQNNDRDDENERSKNKIDTENQNNASNNVSLIDDHNNDTVQNNDSLKPNDSSTNDSGFVNENDTYTLVQTFLSELSGSMKLIYKFIEDSMKDFRNKDLQNDKKKKIHDKAMTTHGHLNGIIYKLQCIVHREADTMTPLKEIILKADMLLVSDKRMMRYRQVVMKCLEQAQMLERALRLLLAIADGDYDVSFCSDNSVYFNIFE